MAVTTKRYLKHVETNCMTLTTIVLTILIHEVTGVNQDVTPPDVHGCPTTAISAQAPPGQWKTQVTWTEPTAVDESPGVTVQKSHWPDAYFYVGSTDVTYLFIDSQYNVATCKFTVNVTSDSYGDVTPPSLKCPTQKTAVVTPEASSVKVDYSVEASDNSGGQVDLYLYPPSGSSFTLGVHTVWVWAADDRYNRAYCSFDVVVSEAGCRHPGNIQNGAMFPDITDTYPVDSKVIFRCQDGYELDGVAEIVCTNQITWSSDLPQCVESDPSRGNMCQIRIGDIFGAVVGSIIGILAIEVMIYIVYNRYRNNQHEKSNAKIQNEVTAPVSRNRYLTNPVASPQQAADVPNSQPRTINSDVTVTSSAYQTLDPSTRDQQHNYMSVDRSSVSKTTGNEAQEDDDGYMKPSEDDGDGYLELIP